MNCVNEGATHIAKEIRRRFNVNIATCFEELRLHVEKHLTWQKFLTGREEIWFQGTTFIKEIKQYRYGNRLMMYWKETFMYISHVTPYTWYDDTEKYTYVPLTKGRGTKTCRWWNRIYNECLPYLQIQFKNRWL